MNRDIKSGINKPPLLKPGVVDQIAAMNPHPASNLFRS